MRKVVPLMLVLWPCSSGAATDCHVIDYPDHSEVLCVGEAEQSPPIAERTGQEQGQGPGQEQGVALAQATEQQLPDVPPENIVRNELARSHGAVWLKANRGQ